MSEETDIENDDDQQESGPIAGERLAEARRELQIPLIEISKELHLDENKVRALERNDFDVIGAPVFAKGHLRKYAQLVNVDEADVMADYYQLDRGAAAPLQVSVGQKPRRVISPGPWLAAIAVVGLVATAYWWFLVREPVAETPASTTISSPVGQLEESTTDESVSLPEATEGEVAPETGDDEAEGPSEQRADEAPVAEEPQVMLPSGPAETQLAVTYSGDCWTEISDASGRRLFFDLGKAGRTVNLTGEAPFNVLFGNAENVSISVDGRSYDIPAANRRGRTARLTINGS